MRFPVFCAVVLLLVLLSVGCVQTHPPGEKSPVDVSVPGGPVQTMSAGTVPSPGLPPKYQAGDIIDPTTNIDKMPHFMILGYNIPTREYTYDIVFRNADGKWYRNFPQPLSIPAHYAEMKAPYLLARIPVTDLFNLYPTREDYMKTL
jgi:hypothetical protein